MWDPNRQTAGAHNCPVLSARLEEAAPSLLDSMAGELDISNFRSSKMQFAGYEMT
jgi:hypothetical protein